MYGVSLLKIVWDALWYVLLGMALILHGIRFFMYISDDVFSEKELEEFLDLMGASVPLIFMLGIYILITGIIKLTEDEEVPRTYLSPKIGEKIVILFFKEFKNEDTDCIRIYYTNTTVSDNPGFLFDMKKEHTYSIKVGKTYLLTVDQKLEEIVT